MKNYIKVFTALLLLSNVSASEKITKPPFIKPHSVQIQKESVIQVPIRIDAQEIKKALLREIKIPVTSKSIEKKSFNIDYEVHLKDLKVSFKGSKIKIFSSYILDFSLSYKDKLKGILDGKVYADLHLMGEIHINDDATFVFKVSKKEIKTEFTKVKIPSILETFDFFHITKAELYLAKVFLADEINKRIFKRIQERISQKQVDIKLSERIQKLVYKHSFATAIDKDLWLLPRPTKVSISQLSTLNNLEANELHVNVGITAHPKLITSVKKPPSNHKQKLPIYIESFEPKVYLYPSIHIRYAYIQKKLERHLNTYITTNYPDVGYSLKNVTVYPSDTKLVISLDVVEKDNPDKVLTFYLWGTPKLNKEFQTISLEDLDYTLESKNALIHTASWLLDEGIKNLIKEKSLFSYKNNLSQLLNKVSSVEDTSRNGTLKANTRSLSIENIVTSKDALIVYALAKGTMSYTVKIKER